MGKRISMAVMVLIMLLSTGCEFNLTGAEQNNAQNPSDFELATIAASANEATSTPDNILRLPTPTLSPIPDASNVGGEAENNSVVTGNIALKTITEKSPGIALITWEATGNFPAGFKVVWSDQQKQPSYPEDSSSSVVSSTARSAVISFTADTIYYVRVCGFMADKCEVYSDLGIFAFAPPTPTPTITKTIPAIVVNGTSIPYDPSLKITLMKGGETGKAYMEWSDKHATSSGYKIVYSTSNTVPVYGTDSSFSVPDSSARSAYVDGNSKATYYYRICRYSSSGCTSYSAVYTYTFPVASTATPDSASITISSIVDSGIGAALVSWAGTGDFPYGFKILYSKTTALPTLSDSVVVVSDGSARQGTISGDPSATYHVRVCKYNGSSCSIYSGVVDFTFAADSSTITLDSVVDGASAGDMNLSWTPSGSFPNGFKLLYSTTEATPTYENASMVAAGSADTTGTINGTADTHYYVRVCKFTGSGCSIYSNIVEFTTIP
mgnify:CR=1 FL=1